MKCHTHYVWKWLLCLAPSHRGTGGIGRWWHEWDPPLTVTMGTGPRVTSGNAQQSPSSSSTRRGKNLKRLGVTNNQDVSLSRDWHFHYASPQVRVSGQSMSMVPCFEGEKKKKRKLPSAIESLARCRQLVWWNLHWCIRLAVDFYEQIRQQQNLNPLRHWGIIYPFVSAICLFEQETAMRIKQLPAHIGLICSLISACILLPAPTTTTECIQHLIRHAVSPALLLLA